MSAEGENIGTTDLQPSEESKSSEGDIRKAAEAGHENTADEADGQFSVLQEQATTNAEEHNADGLVHETSEQNNLSQDPQRTEHGHGVEEESSEPAGTVYEGTVDKTSGQFNASEEHGVVSTQANDSGVLGHHAVEQHNISEGETTKSSNEEIVGKTAAQSSERGHSSVAVSSASTEQNLGVTTNESFDQGDSTEGEARDSTKEMIVRNSAGHTSRQSDEHDREASKSMQDENVGSAEHERLYDGSVDVESSKTTNQQNIGSTDRLTPVESNVSEGDSSKYTEGASTVSAAQQASELSNASKVVASNAAEENTASETRSQTFDQESGTNEEASKSAEQDVGSAARRIFKEGVGEDVSLGKSSNDVNDSMQYKNVLEEFWETNNLAWTTRSSDSLPIKCKHQGRTDINQTGVLLKETQVFDGLRYSSDYYWKFEGNDTVSRGSTNKGIAQVRQIVEYANSAMTCIVLRIELWWYYDGEEEKCRRRNYPMTELDGRVVCRNNPLHELLVADAHLGDVPKDCVNYYNKTRRQFRKRDHRVYAQKCRKLMEK
uniref:Lipocalin n=1 Tax=Rhipicephalus zambeziensis TaxID=60191 RepID=A0A224YLS8_9ACAR